jgi:hypothetical protein
LSLPPELCRKKQALHEASCPKVRRFHLVSTEGTGTMGTLTTVISGKKNFFVYFPFLLFSLYKDKSFAVDPTITREGLDRLMNHDGNPNCHVKVPRYFLLIANRHIV